MERIFFHFKAFCLASIFLLGLCGISNAQCPTQASVLIKTHTDISCFGANDGTITVDLDDASTSEPYNFELFDLTAGAFVTFLVTEVENKPGRSVVYSNVPPGSYAVAFFKAGCTPIQIVESIFGSIVLEPTQLTVSPTIIPDCDPTVGTGTGKIDIAISGATPPYAPITWTGPTAIANGTTSTASNLDAGTYTVNITDANGCNISQNILVPITTLADAGPATGQTCGVNSFALSGNAAGAGEIGTWTGPAGVTFSPNANDPNATANNLNVGSNTITWTITDTGGVCAGTSDNISVTFSPAVTITPTVTNILCNGLSTGQIDIAVSGGIAPYTFLWSTGALTEDVTGLSAGSYNVTVTDSQGCPTTLNGIAVTQPALLTLNSSNILLLCNGDTNGSGTFTAGGGTAPYTFSVVSNTTGGTTATAATTLTLSNAGVGAITVQVQDANGCTASSTITVTQPTALTLNNSGNVALLCNGNTNGSGTFTAGGGISPYTFTVVANTTGGTTATAATTLTLSNAGVGSITVQVQDANGCTIQSTINITAPPVLTLNNSGNVALLCNGNTNGSGTFTAGGGTAPYTFSVISNTTGGTTATAATTLTLSNAGVGSITVQTQDANGCTTQSTINITAPTVLTLNNSGNVALLCNGNTNGAGTFTAGGGTAPYTFSIVSNTTGGTTATAATTLTLANAGVGSITVQVQDANGCTALSTISFTQPTLLTLNNSGNVALLCNGNTNGSGTFTAGGGTSPYTFSIISNTTGGTTATAATTLTLSNAGVGSITVQVQDANGCTTQSTINVTAPAVLTLNNSGDVALLCNGNTNGSGTFTAGGGTAPYTFSVISNTTGGTTATAATTLTLSNAGVGSITVQTQDANGCTTQSTINITAPTVLTLNNSGNVALLCNGNTNGSGTFTAGGGTAPYTFSIVSNTTGGTTATAATTLTLSNAGAGAITVQAQDANGCTAVSTITITQPTTLTLSNSGNIALLCNGNTNGSGTFTAGGGTAPYTFSVISNTTGGTTATAATTLTLSNAGVGSITVQVQDANGCTTQSTINVTAPAVLTLNNSGDVALLCNGNTNGSGTFTAGGGTAPYTFSVITNTTGGTTATAATTLTLSNAGVGSITVQTQDANGCTTQSTINITAPTVLTLNNSGNVALLCNGNTNGSGTFTAGGGTAPYTFSIISNTTGGTTVTAATTLTLSNAGAGAITVQAQDANGCTVQSTITITQPTTLTLTNSGDIALLCNGDTDGAGTFTAGGGTSPYAFTVITNTTGATTSTTTTDLTFLNAGAGAITIEVQDANGCTVQSTINITEPVAIVVTGIVAHNTKCAVPFNGAIVLTVTPAVGYSFSWTGPNGYTSNSKNITALEAGSYQVTVTDLVSGCPVVQNFTVNDNAPTLALAVDANSGNTSCLAPFDGALLITASGGSGVFGYSWTGPNGFTSTQEDLANLENGDYTVVVTDLNLGCTVSSTSTVADNTSTVIIASQNIVPNTVCLAPFTGSITITAGGTLGPHTFSWTGPNGYSNTGPSISGLESGDYVVTITDQVLGCADSYTLNVGDATPPVTITVDATTPNTSCQSPFDGAIQITAGGTPGPFDFSWTGPNAFVSTLEDLALVEDGDYTVTVTDQLLGCSATLVINVGDNKPVIAIAATTITPNTNCQSPFNGDITVSATGTAGPFVFSWTGPNGYSNTGATIGTLESGDYTVVATDQVLGCTSTLIVNVPDNTPTISITTSVNPNTTCVAPFDGSIDILTITGTPGPYTFSWLGPNGFTSGNQNITALESGAYIVTITDNLLGCSDSDTLTVGDNAPVIAAAPTIAPNASCLTPFDGAIDIAVSGTPGPFTFSWTGPNSFSAATEDITALEGGDYDVLITDNLLGCSASFTFNVPDNSTNTTVTLNSLTNNTSCLAPFNGAISVTAGGTPGPFTISWTGPGGFTSASATISGLSPGSYNVTVTDNLLGCSASNSYTVLNSAVGCGGANCGAYTVTITETRPSCAGQDDGELIFTIAGGTPGYIVTIFDPVSGFIKALPDNTPPYQIIFEDLSPADYQYTIQDQAGNICTLPYSLKVQTIVTASADPLSFVDALCFGQPTGRARLIATGGTSPYEYSVDGTNWTSFVSGDVVTDLPPNGTYNILVRDDASDLCNAEVSVTINNANPAIVATITDAPATCNNNDGSLSVTNVSGGAGTGGYEFSIDGITFQSEDTFNDLAGGIYVISVRDIASGCVQTFNGNVTFPGFVNFNVVPTDATCFNAGLSGSIVVMIPGAGPGYKVALSTDQSTVPADEEYDDYFDPSYEFGELSQGRYFVFVKAPGVSCPTRSAAIDINGIVAVDFDIAARCEDSKASISLTNISYDPINGSRYIDVYVYERGTGDLLATVRIDPVPPTASYELKYEDFDFLRAPGTEVEIQLEQFNEVEFCPVRSPLKLYMVNAPLSARVGETKESYPDILNGSIQVFDFDGGQIPYDIRIELDSASVDGQFYQTDWEEVTKNNNLQFEKIYTSIPAGRYKIEIEDSLGCAIQLTGRVPLDTDIYIPNIFTPNGDGTNDVFFIRNLPDKGAKLTVTDRWGKRVYSSESYQNSWNAEDVSDGVYFYNLTASGHKPVSGWIEILRGSKP